MRVKVCGVRRVADALAAASLGADAIGLLVGQLHRSEDFLEPDDARDIARRLPPFVSPVLVTHIEDGLAAAELAHFIGVTTVQMHSDCSASALMQLRAAVPSCKIIRAIHATGPEVLSEMRALEHLVDAFLVDSVNYSEDRVGGTGLTHDWTLTRRVVEESERPIILAGGLHDGNVGDAIHAVQPFGVDANTRLRDTTGFKSREKMAAFVEAAKCAFFEVGGRPGSDEPERDDQ